MSDAHLADPARRRVLQALRALRLWERAMPAMGVGDREAERKLMPAARAQGKAVIVNRPFRTGELFELVAGKPVPKWAVDELKCRTWSQYFLKFVISHPGVTCAIPATSSAAHMRENMEALRGPLPDAKQRQRMIEDFERSV